MPDVRIAAPRAGGKGAARQGDQHRGQRHAHPVAAARPAMRFAVVSRRYPHTRSTVRKESIMTATYTFDVFSTVDGFGSYNSSGDWGGYWGKQGPEFLNRRLAQYREEQRLVLGANTFRQFMHFLGPG